jgi:hypothetical protein
VLFQATDASLFVVARACARAPQAIEASQFVLARCRARLCDAIAATQCATHNCWVFAIPHRRASLRPLTHHSLLLPVLVPVLFQATEASLFVVARARARAAQATEASHFVEARARAAEAGRLAISHCIFCYESMKSKS